MVAAITPTVIPIIVSCINLAVAMLQVHNASSETTVAKVAYKKKKQSELFTTTVATLALMLNMGSMGMSCNIHTKRK